MAELPGHGITADSPLVHVLTAIKNRKISSAEAADIHPEFKQVLEERGLHHQVKQSAAPVESVAPSSDKRTQTAANKKRAELKQERDAKLKTSAAKQKPIKVPKKKAAKRAVPKNHGLADPGRRAHAREAFELARLERDLKILDINPNYNPKY